MSLCLPTSRLRVAADLFHSDHFAPSSFHLSSFPSSSTPAAFRRRNCAIQKAIPGVGETLYNGLGYNTNGAIIKLQNLVLEGASHLGLALPSQESTVWWWAVVAPLVLSYLFATPGSAAGLADYVYAPMHAQSFRTFAADDVEIGRQLGEGSFGVVYEGFFGRGRKGAKSKGLHVVLKKAKTGVKGVSEVHTSEIHMNYRLQRTVSYACAEFLGTMQVKPNDAHGKLSQGVWLVWNFQGDRSLDYYLKQKNFPENLSAVVLNEKVQALTQGEVFKRNLATIKSVFRQILSNLQDLHRSGVVHRDIKPLNLILDQDSGTFKLIDFGACVDLRSGFNYVPKETVIDPTYAAPEHYVMPTSTPNLPPDPLCSLVSPVLWHLNTPDRFDLYSAGLILMQLSLKPLRHDTGLQAFNIELKRTKYNLKVWRANCRYGKEEFAYLDADGGAGWELVSALLQPRHDKDNLIWPSLGNSRPSASAALQHQFLKGSPVRPKSFPKELEDAPVVRVLPAFEGVLPAFEGLAHKLGSAAMNVFDATRVNLPVSILEKKAKLTVPSNPSRPLVPNFTNIMISDKQRNGLKNVKTKEPDHVSNTGSNPALISEMHVSFRKTNRMIQEAFNGRTETAGGESATMTDSKKVDVPTTGGKKVDGMTSSSVVTEKLSHMIQGAFNGRADTPGGKDMNVATTGGEKVNEAKGPAVKPVFEEQGKSMGPSNVKSTGTVFGSFKAALPVAATSAVTLATGWLVLSGLSSSAQASYELGKLLMSSSGVSGSAFLAFFLVVKPWIEEQGALVSENKARNDPVETASPVETAGQENFQLEKYKSIHAEPVKVQVVVEAVQELELQMSSLEALMLQEQQVSRQHMELVEKMESLLLQPTGFQDKKVLVEVERT